MRWTLTTALAASCLALDIFSKGWAERSLSSEPYLVLPFFSLQLGFNSGVAFSLFSSDNGENRHYITAMTSVLSVGIAYMAMMARSAADRVGFSLVLGGALGNVIDRVQDGFVTDFISLQAGRWHFPTFNLADTFITVGLLILLKAMMPAHGSKIGT